MPVMPSSRSRRRVEIPASQYDRLKSIADAEERTVAAVAAELLGQALRSYQPLPPAADGFAPTPRAARVLELARGAVPASFGHNYVGTEHLLLGLVLEEHGIGGKVLRGLGVTEANVREAIGFMIGRGPQSAAVHRDPVSGAPVRATTEQPATPPAVTDGPPMDTPRTRKVLALALGEATRLDHGFVGTGHLLLGLIREGEGIAIGILTSLGTDLAAARRGVVEAFERHEMPLSQS